MGIQSFCQGEHCTVRNRVVAILIIVVTNMIVQITHLKIQRFCRRSNKIRIEILTKLMPKTWVI